MLKKNSENFPVPLMIYLVLGCLMELGVDSILGRRWAVILRNPSVSDDFEESSAKRITSSLELIEYPVLSGQFN